MNGGRFVRASPVVLGERAELREVSVFDVSVNLYKNPNCASSGSFDRIPVGSASASITKCWTHCSCDEKEITWSLTKKTLQVYDDRAEDYAKCFARDHGKDPALRDFVAGLPKGACVLDLGCGPGSWAGAMIAKGLSVDAVDASAGMVAMASKIPGLNVQQAEFGDLSSVALYDGVWANFSLLHAPRSDMTGHLMRIHRALKPGGLLHIGLKTGTGEHRDALGRLYTYYAPDEIIERLTALGMTLVTQRTGRDPGLDGTLADWFILSSRKPD